MLIFLGVRNLPLKLSVYRNRRLATNDDVSARIAELTQELSADFMMAAEPFAASVDFTQAGVQRHWKI